MFRSREEGGGKQIKGRNTLTEMFVSNAIANSNKKWL